MGRLSGISSIVGQLGGWSLGRVGGYDVENGVGLRRVLGISSVVGQLGGWSLGRVGGYDVENGVGLRRVLGISSVVGQLGGCTGWSMWRVGGYGLQHGVGLRRVLGKKFCGWSIGWMYFDTILLSCFQQTLFFFYRAHIGWSFGCGVFSILVQAISSSSM